MARGLPTGEILEGRYRIDDFYAYGGMAVVYRATDQKLDRTVAVKVMNAGGTGTDSFRRRFSREAQALAHFGHPHIVAIHDFGETPEGLPYLVMAFVSGPSVDWLLNQSRSLDLNLVCKVIEGVASALDYVHATGALHRDVKPSNILLGADDFPYLADFGIASIADRSSLTGAFQPGTDRYASREQIRSGEDLTPQSDQFSLACVAYEMITGRPLFGEDMTKDILNRTLGVVPDPALLRPSSVPAVHQVLKTALSPDPSSRFPNSSDFARALAAALRESAVTEARQPKPAATRLSIQANRASVWPTGLFVAHLVGGGPEIQADHRSPRLLSEVIDQARAHNLGRTISSAIGPGLPFAVDSSGLARTQEGKEIARVAPRDWWWGVIFPEGMDLESLPEVADPLPIRRKRDQNLRTLDSSARVYWGLASAGTRPKFKRFFSGGWRFGGYRHEGCPHCHRALAEFDKDRGFDGWGRRTRWRAYFCPSCVEVFGSGELGAGVSYPHDYRVE